MQGEDDSTYLKWKQDFIRLHVTKEIDSKQRRFMVNLMQLIFKNFYWHRPLPFKAPIGAPIMFTFSHVLIQFEKYMLFYKQ